MSRDRTTILDRLIAEASVLAGGEHPCSVLGHKWKHIGGRNCGCRNGHCSFPVHECEACGDCDYGDNAEAREIKLECECVAELN
jgi:hypothetical protein